MGWAPGNEHTFVIASPGRRARQSSWKFSWMAASVALPANNMGGSQTSPYSDPSAYKGRSRAASLTRPLPAGLFNIPAAQKKSRSRRPAPITSAQFAQNPRSAFLHLVRRNVGVTGVHRDTHAIEAAVDENQANDEDDATKRVLQARFHLHCDLHRQQSE